MCCLVWFHARSQTNDKAFGYALAVWGLPEQDYFCTGAALERGDEFSIDLVEIQHARPELLASIQQGVEL